MRRIVVVAIVLAGLLAAGLGLLAWSLRNTTTPVTVTTAGVAGDPGDPGVYAYATDGFEEVDALAGARHDYPEITYLTISTGPCGPLVRWDALAERWVEWEHCGPGGAITRTTSYHQWFGIPDLEVEECTPPAPLVPGTEITTVCVAGDRTETYTRTPLGRETIQVAGNEVEVDRVRIVSTVTGSTTGSTTTDIWVYPGTVLVVQITVEAITTTPSAVGDVHHTERYTAVLTALTPS